MKQKPSLPSSRRRRKTRRARSGGCPNFGWKINYPEIGYPEFCQLIEQEKRDPNKALGQSIKLTVYLEFAF